MHPTRRGARSPRFTDTTVYRMASLPSDVTPRVLTGRGNGPLSGLRPLDVEGPHEGYTGAREEQEMVLDVEEETC